MIAQYDILQCIVFIFVAYSLTLSLSVIHCFVESPLAFCPLIRCHNIGSSRAYFFGTVFESDGLYDVTMSVRERDRPRTLVQILKKKKDAYDTCKLCAICFTGGAMILVSFQVCDRR